MLSYTQSLVYSERAQFGRARSGSIEQWHETFACQEAGIVNSLFRATNSLFGSKISLFYGKNFSEDPGACQSQEIQNDLPFPWHARSTVRGLPPVGLPRSRPYCGRPSGHRSGSPPAPPRPGSAPADGVSGDPGADRVPVPISAAQSPPARHLAHANSRRLDRRAIPCLPVPSRPPLKSA